MGQNDYTMTILYFSYFQTEIQYAELDTFRPPSQQKNIAPKDPKPMEPEEPVSCCSSHTAFPCRLDMKQINIIGQVFDCEILMIADCELFWSLQSKESQSILECITIVRYGVDHCNH